MKAIILITTALALTSCSMSGSYTSTNQNFDFNSSIVIPVKAYKK